MYLGAIPFCQMHSEVIRFSANCVLFVQLVSKFRYDSLVVPPPQRKSFSRSVALFVFSIALRPWVVIIADGSHAVSADTGIACRFG